MGAYDESRIIAKFNAYRNVYAIRRRHKGIYTQEADILVDGYKIVGYEVKPIRLMIEEKSTTKKTYYLYQMDKQYDNMLYYAMRMLRIPYLVVVFKVNNGYSYAYTNLFEVKQYGSKVSIDDGYNKISEFVGNIVSDGINYYPKLIEKIKENVGVIDFL